MDTSPLRQFDVRLSQRAAELAVAIPDPAALKTLATHNERSLPESVSLDIIYPPGDTFANGPMRLPGAMQITLTELTDPAISAALNSELYCDQTGYTRRKFGGILGTFAAAAAGGYIAESLTDSPDIRVGTMIACAVIGFAGLAANEWRYVKRKRNTPPPPATFAHPVHLSFKARPTKI